MSHAETSPVLVTGGAGYVGRHVVRALGSAGYPVVVVDDLSSGHRGAVPAGAVFVEADAGDRAAIAAVIDRHRIAAAVHLAGALGEAGAALCDRVNRAASATFAEACAEGGVTRFVLTSSAAVYGDGGAEAAPLTPYGASKLAGEQALARAFADTGGGHVVLRCFNVAGAGPALRTGPRPLRAAGLVEAACEAALGLREHVTVFGADYPTRDGTCVRDYVHPADVAEAHVAALGLIERGGADRTLDCGCGCGYTVREVLAAVERVAGVALAVREGPRRDGDVPEAVARTGPIRRALGWRPRHAGLDAMVASTLAWVAARPGKARKPFGKTSAGRISAAGENEDSE